MSEANRWYRSAERCINMITIKCIRKKSTSCSPAHLHIIYNQGFGVRRQKKRWPDDTHTHKFCFILLDFVSFWTSNDMTSVFVICTTVVFTSYRRLRGLHFSSYWFTYPDKTLWFAMNNTTLIANLHHVYALCRCCHQLIKLRSFFKSAFVLLILFVCVFFVLNSCFANDPYTNYVQWILIKSMCKWFL